MKGADQCPKCGSRKFAQGYQEITPFYSKHLRICRNGACGAAWEFFEQAQLLDEHIQNSSFKEPCENCAFRPGSHEQQDPEKWKELMAKLEIGEDGFPRGQFFCHKGVALDIKRLSATDSGFDYPTKNGKPHASKLRPCRGFLNMTAKQWDKIRAGAHKAIGAPPPKTTMTGTDALEVLLAEYCKTPRK